MVLWCPQWNWDESAWGRSVGLCDAVRCRPSTMAILLVRLLSVLGLLQLTLKLGDQPDKATQELMEKRVVMLQQEMRVLLQEIEKGTEPQSGNSMGFLFLSVCHHWQFWALSEALLAVFGMYWLPRKIKDDTNGDSEPWSSNSEDADGGEEEEKDEVKEGLLEEEKDWEEGHLTDHHDPGFLVSQLRESLLPKLRELQVIMEEMASANSHQRSLS
eukprot:XP_027303822.1 uncharacterized protein LOC113841359 [Anas platyrhynchos]